MKIGLLIAIDRELEAFLKSGEERTEEQVAGRTVYRTRLEGHEVYAVRSGCGEIDASAATMLLIVRYGCALILNFGVAGALEADLKVDDLFAVEKVCHYDFDTSAFDPVKKGQYAEYPDEFIPLDAGMVRLAEGTVPGIRRIAAASGDKFVEDRDEKLRLRGMGCGICDMEIAAILALFFSEPVVGDVEPGQTAGRADAGEPSRTILVSVVRNFTPCRSL